MQRRLLLWARLAFSLLLLVLLFHALGTAQPVKAQDGNYPVKVYMFWGDGCPHCAAAKPFFEDLAKQYPNVELKFYEVWYNDPNQQMFKQLSAAYGFEPGGVPTIFIGDQHWEGFSDALAPVLEKAIKTCSEQGCPDPGARINLPGSEPGLPAPAESAGSSETETNPDVINIPLIGQIDLTHQSLAISTALIAFVDGVNPCSVWVLTMLLALTLHSGSRKKVVIIGIVFLTVTAAIYALFIGGLFTIFTFVSYLGWIEVVVAVVALFFAIVNIKDYFWYKEGISFTIADDKKPGIFQRMRRLMDASQSFWGLVGATVVMAAGVSLVEFSCTAGFPVIWTNLLAAQDVTMTAFILLLLLYMVIYQLDELVIFFVAVFSLKASRLEEKQGRILKLIGGMLMLTLAAVMLFSPKAMNTLSSSLIVFAVAFGLTLLVLLLHRVILPRFGINIGSEFSSGRKNKRKAALKGHRHG